MAISKTTTKSGIEVEINWSGKIVNFRKASDITWTIFSFEQWDELLNAFIKLQLEKAKFSSEDLEINEIRMRK